MKNIYRVVKHLVFWLQVTPPFVPIKYRIVYLSIHGIRTASELYPVFSSFSRARSARGDNIYAKGIERSYVSYHPNNA